jgi:hypothetical protein
MIYIPDERTDQGPMAKNVGKPETAKYCGKLAVMARCS